MSRRVPGRSPQAQQAPAVPAGISDQTHQMGGAGYGYGQYYDETFDGRFPTNVGEGEGDFLNWMHFIAKEITGGFTDKKVVKFGNPSGSVALPIPPGISESIDQNWSQSTAGLGAMITQRALQNLPAAQQGISNFVGSAFGQDTSNEDLPVIAENIQLGDTAAEGLGMLLRKVGVGESTQYNLGARALDQLMMSYGGPTFRNFTWTFPLKPLNAGDSKAIDDIVNFFKYRSAPQSSNAQFTRLYKLPNGFEVHFMWGQEEHTRLPKIGHVALTNINVQYGGDIFRTYSDPEHSPVQVNLALSFKEMELLDRQSFGRTEKFSTNYSAADRIGTPNNPWQGEGSLG